MNSGWNHVPQCPPQLFLGQVDFCCCHPAPLTISESQPIQWLGARSYPLIQRGWKIAYQWKPYSLKMLKVNRGGCSTNHFWWPEDPEASVLRILLTHWWFFSEKRGVHPTHMGSGPTSPDQFPKLFWMLDCRWQVFGNSNPKMKHWIFSIFLNPMIGPVLGFYVECPAYGGWLFSATAYVDL